MAQDIDLNRLQIFKEVVLAGSFSKAAAQLRQPKSRVSRNISALEKELGVQLIYRTTRQFQLTPAGTDLFQRTTPLLNEIKNSIDHVTTGADEVAGFIRVTVPEDIGVELMGEFCQEFLRLYPKVQIDIHVGNVFVDLVKESIDIAVRIGKARDSTLIQKKVGSISMVLVMSPSLIERHGGLSRLENLEKIPYLAFAPGDPRKPQTIKVTNGKETRALKFTPVFSSNNFFVLRQLSERGAGLTMMPAFLAHDSIRDGRLIYPFPDWQTEGAPMQILIPHQKETPIRIRKFIDFLTRKLQLYI